METYDNDIHHFQANWSLLDTQMILPFQTYSVTIVGHKQTFAEIKKATKKPPFIINID